MRQHSRETALELLSLSHAERQRNHSVRLHLSPNHPPVLVSVILVLLVLVSVLLVLVSVLLVLVSVLLVLVSVILVLLVLVSVPQSFAPCTVGHVAGKQPVPSPTLSPTDPVPRGLLTLCPAAY